MRQAQKNEIYMKSFTKQLIFIFIAVIVFGVGIAAVIAVNNRGNPPVAYWKFDEGAGATAYDAAGANDGTITNALWRNEPDCKIGKCLYFDGTGDFVDIGAGPSVVQTVSFWVKPITTTEYPIDLNGTAYIWLNAGVVTAQGFTSPTIYVNGIVSSTVVANSWQFVSVTTGIAINASDLDIGRIEFVGDSEGFIDEPKIYNYARSASQIKADYLGGGSRGATTRVAPTSAVRDASQGLIGHWKMDETSWTNNCSTGTVLDASGNAKHAKSCPTTTGPTGGAAGKYGTGGSLDGSDDYVEIPDVDF